MANTVIALKKSATPTAAPADLANGELAINYADGKLYYKNVTGQIVSISSGGNNFGTVNANNTLVVADTSGDVLTLEPGTNISIVGDAVNDKVTIGLQNDVVIPSTGTFKVAAVGGDEGGEIKLANAITNSVLTGDIVIDVYQNRLRFYESAGTNRGAFINLASAATGVGTDLLAASATDTVARNAAGAAFDKANTANITADLAFNKANAALPNTSDVSFDGTLFFPTGNVGIRTTTSIVPLSISFDNTAEPTSGGGRLLQLENANTATDSKTAIQFYGTDAGGTLRHGASVMWGKSGPWTNGGNDYASYLGFYTRPSGSTQLERMRIDSNGNVGIGTSSPTTNLHVAGSLFVTQNNTTSLDVTGEIAEFAHNANNYTQIHIRNANTGTQASGDIVVTADSGTDSIDFVDLGINSSGYSQAGWTINGAKDAYLYASNGNFAIGVSNVARSLTFFTGGTLAANERARFDPTGNLLIGRTDSTVGQSVKVDVNGAINASAVLVNGTAVGSGGITLTDQSTVTQLQYPLFTTRTSGSASVANVASTKLTYNVATGTLSTTNFNSTSDINKKENVTTLQYPFDILSEIYGVRFTWKDNKLPSVGVIAQDVEKVLPELVGDEKSVNYNGLIAVLIEAIKELKAEIEILKSKQNGI